MIFRPNVAKLIFTPTQHWKEETLEKIRTIRIPSSRGSVST